MEIQTEIGYKELSAELNSFKIQNLCIKSFHTCNYPIDNSDFSNV